jgi:predicted DNA-binding transcriptional regulator YafY
MNRTDRLLAIVLELQARGRQRAEDLAATFETSKRTIYRDIQALGEAGVPLISVPGRGYALMKGYFLPPLSFNSEEATMLLLGSGMMAQSFDAQYRLAAQSASRKIAGVLPEQLRAEVEYLQTAIRFIASNLPEESQEKLSQLRRAIIDRVTVRFVYHTRHRPRGEDEPRMREADPYALVCIRNVWYLSAYCHLRQAMRHFRFDRMEQLEVLSRTFQRLPGVSLEPRQRDEPGGLLARVLFDHEVARWVREAPSFHTVCEEETSEGLLVTLKIRQESEILQWLLSWGRHVRVLEPEALCQRHAEEAESILAQYVSHPVR